MYYSLYITYIIQLTPQRDFSETDYIKYYAYLYHLLSLHGKKRRARCSTGLNNVLLPTLFTLVNNIEHYCWAWIGCNNIVQCCWQPGTMWAAKHCSILFFINIASTWAFFAVYTRKNWENQQLVASWYRQAWTRLCGPLWTVLSTCCHSIVQL